MNLHKNHSAAAANDDAPLAPCPQMRTLLSRLADGSLTSGPLHWYATHHAHGCQKCHAALISLQAISDRLRTLGLSDVAPPPASEPAALSDALVLSGDRWEAVQAAWQAADAAPDAA